MSCFGVALTLFLFCRQFVADDAPNTDEIYDDIFKLLEEKETLEQELEKLGKLNSKGKLDESCSIGEKKLKFLSNVVEERISKAEELKIELNDAKERKHHMQHLERDCRGDDVEDIISVEDRVHFRGRYTFSVDPVERVAVDGSQVKESLKHGKPVVIKGSNLTASTIGKWSIEYLQTQLVSNEMQLYVTPNRQFKSYTLENRGNYSFDLSHVASKETFRTFLNIADILYNTANGSRFKSDLQSSLLAEAGWGELEQEVLSVGMADRVIHTHYNMAENLVVQVFGHQKFVLFNPTEYANLYPFPIHHPQDRQSQVNFDGPNFDMFPQFREARGLQVIVSPGDIVYIPSYWWHYIESADQGMTVSLDFLFQPSWMEKNKGDIIDVENDVSTNQSIFSVPDDVKEIRLQRDIETLIGSTVHPSKIKKILKTTLERRFDFL